MVRRWPPAALLIVAGLLFAPSLVVGTLLTHSSPANLTWATQFAEQVRAGILYPRWMPDSFDGLGGPAFYFYPPLPFWIDALASIATLNLLSVPYRLGLTSVVLLWLSGLAMHAWLRREARERAAFWGAVAYMAAPYHLLDHLMRGAFAEFTGYIFLPLVVLAGRLIANGRWRGGLRCCVFLCRALMSHLPTALLVSLTVLPLYVLFTSALRRAAAAPCRRRCTGDRARGALSCCQRWSCNPGSRPTSSGPRSTAPSNWFVIAPERWRRSRHDAR